MNVGDMSLWISGAGPLRFVLFSLFVLWLGIWFGIKEDRK